MSFGTFRVIGSSTALIGAGNSQTDHVAADEANTWIFATAVYQMQSFYFMCSHIIRALGMQHKTTYMDKSTTSLFFLKPAYFEF